MRIAESTQESALDKSPPRHQTTSPHSPQTGRRSRIHHVETSMIQNDVEAGPWTESDEEEEAEINASLGSLGAHDANLSDDPNQVPEDSNSRARAFDPSSQNPDISKGTIISDSQPSQAQTHSQQSPSFHRRHPSSPIHTGQSQDSPTTRHVSKSTKRLGSKVEVVIPVLGLNHQGLLVESSVMESPEHSKKAMFPSPSRTKISPSTLLRSIASSPATSRALGPLPNLSPTQFKPYIHSGKQGASGTVDDSLSQIESFESPLSKRRIGIRSNGPDELVDEIEEIEDEPPDRSGSRDWESVGFKGPRTDEKPKRPLSDFLKPSTSVTDTLTEDDGVQEDVQASMDQDVPESESRNMNAVVDTSQPVVPPSQITDDSIISVNVAPPLPPKEAREVQVQTQSSVADSQALIDEIKATHTAELSKLRETISRLEDQTAESERNLRLSNDNVDTLNITLDYIKSLKESGDSDLENMKDLYRSAAARSADLEDDNRKLRKEIEKLEGQVQFSSKQVRLSFEAEIGMYKERLKAQDHHVKFVMEQAKRTGIKLSAGEGDEEEVAKGDEVRRRAAEWSMLSKEVAKLKKTVAEAGEKEEMLRVLLGEAEQRTSQRSTALRELRKSNLQLETDITNLRQESENWKELARQREDVWTCEWINLETRKQCGAEFTDLENAKNHVENEHAREEVLRPNGAPM
ncbi:hypothetical protein FRC03_002040 [Tulasnella sp. 419]|nr:hypothetical protein FRC03_002040 [Tulasnella sp. 419]